MSDPDQWVGRARYDLDTARAMLGAERFLYVIFCCQQAIEKALKALIAQRTSETPPRSHNLPASAEAAELDPDADRAELFRVLTNAYIESRYPATATPADGSVTRAEAAGVLDQTEEACEWVLSLLT